MLVQNTLRSYLSYDAVFYHHVVFCACVCMRVRACLSFQSAPEHFNPSKTVCISMEMNWSFAP